MTNFKAIHKMNIKELAIFLAKILDCEYCMCRDENCTINADKNTKPNKWLCFDTILEWLQEEI